jgi:hypothetical protein
MARKREAVAEKKYYTAREANAALPLVRAIVRDIMQLAAELRERSERLQKAGGGRQRIDDAHREELQQLQAELERDQEKIGEYFAELARLGIELKDPFTGLIDFPCWMNDHEVYLCWRYGEPQVAHWHELDAGFAGRQKLQESGIRGQESGISN